MGNVARLRAGAGYALFDTDTGSLVGLSHHGREFISRAAKDSAHLRRVRAGGASPRSPETAGLLRLAVPRDDDAAHHLIAGIDATPAVEQAEQRLTLTYQHWHSRHGAQPIEAVITLQGGENGLRMRAVVTNHGTAPIAQLAFPQFLGIVPTGDREASRLQLARHRLNTFVDLGLRVDDLWWVNWKAQRYFPYGSGEFAMKWFDHGDTEAGFSVWATDQRWTTQGIAIDKPSPHDDEAELRWIHYPMIAVGETWDSGDFVVLTHDGDWHAGARAYAEFAREAYPYHAPPHIRECLAIRSLWPRVRNSEPTFTFAELDSYVAECADPSYGIGEVVLWHWWLHNGLPMVIDPALGSADDLQAALRRSAELGVRICLFVSHNIVRLDSPPEWRHENAAGLPVQDNWTYGFDFIPRFQCHFAATHAMQIAAPLSASWQETSLAEYAKALDLGGRGLMFDVFRAPADPEYNPAAQGRADESGEALLELARKARELVHQHDPEGTFAGEFAADTKMSVVDYTWEWINSYQIADSAPLRLVFPQFRLNANTAHPRAAIIGFAEGALINVMPGGMQTVHLSEADELARTLQELAALRRRWLPYFTQGEFRAAEGLFGTWGDTLIRIYSYRDPDGAAGERILVIAANPTDQPCQIQVGVDPRIWGGAATPRAGKVYDQTGKTLAELDFQAELKFSATIGADQVVCAEFLV